MVIVDDNYQEYVKPLSEQLITAKAEKVTILKALRDAQNLLPMTSHQAKELIQGSDGEFTIGELVYFIFGTSPTSNPATEPSSICFTTILRGLSNPAYYLRYSCKIDNGDDTLRSGYVALTPALCADIMSHAERRNTQNIVACNDKEKLINACTTLEELALIDVTTLL